MRLCVRDPMLRAALCLAFAIVTWAGEDSDRMEERMPAQGLLWQVESGTATVYLLGVIHVGNDRLYPLSPAIESAFARADVLVQEMKSDPNSQSLLHKMIFEVGVYPPGESLEQHLGADVLALYQSYLRKASVDPNTLTRLRPWVAAWMISMNEARRLGYNYNRGVATYLRQRAEGDKKEILGLETPADYAELFKALSEETQEVLLRMTLTQVDTFPETMERMIDLWRKGDARAAEKMVQELPDVSSLLPILGGDRNRRMTARIEEYLQTERTYLVTVGAGHLVGKDGLVDRLRRRGHAVQWLGPEEYALPGGPN